MRRALCLGLLAIGVSVLAGTAGAAAPSDGSLTIKRGDGRLVLGLRGAILGRLGKGELDVWIPMSRSCDDLKVWGAEEEESPLLDFSTGELMYVCPFSGKGIRFRLVGNIGIEVRKGRNLFLTAVGRGDGIIDGAGNADGVWAIDDAPLVSLPNSAREFRLGRPFGPDGD